MYFFCTIFNFDIYFFFTVIRSHNVIENMNDSVNANIPQYIHVHVYVLHFKMYNVTFLCIVIFQQKVAKLIQNPRLKKKPTRIRYSSTYITITRGRTFLFIKTKNKQQLYILHKGIFSQMSLLILVLL